MLLLFLLLLLVAPTAVMRVVDPTRIVPNSEAGVNQSFGLRDCHQHRLNIGGSIKPGSADQLVVIVRHIALSAFSDDTEQRNRHFKVTI